MADKDQPRIASPNPRKVTIFVDMANFAIAV